MEFNKEQIEKAKQCKTLEEFKSLAKNEGLNLSDTDAEKYFQATRVGELNDDELSAVAGGKGSWVHVDTYRFIVTCPFCGDERCVNILKYKNSSNELKYENNPNKCCCGATIIYLSTTMNFEFEKNGEVRDAKSVKL